MKPAPPVIKQVAEEFTVQMLGEKRVGGFSTPTLSMMIRGIIESRQKRKWL
jgi:hypothetical protein